jgi:flagellar biosynthesis/type III secretory pathway M-ring protein FliF/YscJ
MWTFIAVISVIWVGFFAVARIRSKKKNMELAKKKEKPAFRTEEDLDEYGKPMKDAHGTSVDFDDAE